MSTVILSAERLFGFYSYTNHSEYVVGNSSSEYEFSGTQLNFLTSQTSVGVGGLAPQLSVSPDAMPRAGADFVVAGGLTIGGSLGYMSGGGEATSTEDGVVTTTKAGDFSMFLLSPHVGYMLTTSPLISLWLRGGVTIFQATSEAADGQADVTLSGTQLTLDPALVLTPVQNVGILVYPAIDFGLTGNWEATTAGTVTTGNYRFTSYGLAAGLSIML
jgi:hypothetical protein